MMKLTRVKALKGHQLECTFQNGETVVYDMGYVLETNTPMLDPLKDESFFRQVFLESGAPVWPNGYDLCPDAIWMRAVHAKSPQSVHVVNDENLIAIP